MPDCARHVMHREVQAKALRHGCGQLPIFPERSKIVIGFIALALCAEHVDPPCFRVFFALLDLAARNK